MEVDMADKDKGSDIAIGAPNAAEPQDTQNQYTPKHDVLETLPDGRQIVVAAAGRPVPMAQARELGLVKDGAGAGPAETKDEKPGESK
jgi:hypothetical protein